MKIIPVNTQLFFKRAIGVAEHYGFQNVDDVRVTPVKKTGRKLDVHQYRTPNKHYDQHVLPKVLEDYASAVELRKKQPLNFYTPSVVAHPRNPAVRVSTLALNTVGVHDALGEVVVLKSATSILEELGIKNYVLRINSIGDADSSVRFIREVTPIIRSHIKDLPENFAAQMKDNASSAIAMLYEKQHPIVADLPSPLDFLTTPSRKYFKDLLELLELTEIPFVLDDKLYGDHSMYSHTVFEIAEESSENSDGAVVARGGRYDTLTKAYARTVVPAAGIVVAVHTKDQAGPVGRPIRKRPSACLIHIGREARVRSISLIETFRREKIPIEQCLHFERFSEQIAYAQAHNAKYVIIMGQREAHENVVIVRNALDRSQQTIPIEGLTAYLRAVA